DIPAVDIFYMPFLFNSEKLVRAATAKGSPVRGPIDAAIEKTGSKVLWWQAYGGAILLSKSEPLHGPADMKGKKARVFSKTLGTWVEGMGAAPTLVSGSEQYLAYQRGTVDIGMTGVSGVKSRKLWEVMNTITVTNNADIEFIVVVNKKFWDGLPAEQQKIIEAAAAKADASVRDAMSQIEADSYAAAKEHGMTVHEPTAKEIEAWKTSAEPAVKQYLARSGPLGKQLYEAAQKLHGG
ncbi:MAG TPA: TRAP transporter substrate-binding protein DctP, partial [Alphaproteobacteria bacterium]|nr:TRAP transporter substrate-binding protein DctP [Alphaproteobacteria bacterium]